MMKFLQTMSIALFGMVALTACQSLKSTSVNATPILATENTAQSGETVPTNFNINGKIALTTPQQTGSAFYIWSQQGKNFAIELAGALNAGQTNISYNGKTATLTNARGEMTADDPEELLFKATGWQAPISQLPYWITGQLAPSDEKSGYDEQQRLSIAQNADWTANFSYNNQERLPQRIRITHPDGYRVVLSINHLAEPQ